MTLYALVYPAVFVFLSSTSILVVKNLALGSTRLAKRWQAVGVEEKLCGARKTMRCMAHWPIYSRSLEQEALLDSRWLLTAT